MWKTSAKNGATAKILQFFELSSEHSGASGNIQIVVTFRLVPFFLAAYL